MPSQFKYTGPYEALYPGVQDADGKSLVAIPGNTYDLATPPDDGHWVPVEAPPAAPVDTFAALIKKAAPLND